MIELSDVTAQLDGLLGAAGLESLVPGQYKQLSDYLALLLRWNARLNLTAVRDPEAILRRHFVESIAAAQTLPASFATLLDFGSGAGLPGIPIAVCRPSVGVTLAESQSKKAAFLNEAVRTLGLNARVHSGRAEALTARFDVVTLRAVDHMGLAVSLAAPLVAPGGYLAPLTTTGDLAALQTSAGSGFDWVSTTPLPGSDSRILALGRRSS